MRGDWMVAATAAAGLEKRYRGWTVGIARGWRGVRFVAVRDSTGPGVCVVIGSYAEVRAALEAERRTALRAAS
jgi:hypothetical protein